MTTLTYQVGDGATYHIGSDAYPVTVRKVSVSGKTVWATDDVFRASPGVNSYEIGEKVGVFVPVHDKECFAWKKYTLRKDGKFRPTGSKSGYLSPGRSFCQDPSY